MTNPDILYNFNANQGSLDDINSHMHGINDASSDVARVFHLLGHVYTGAGADALQANHTAIQGHLADHMSERLGTHTGANNQMDHMQGLDVHQAKQLGG
jgi:hypothetical protein